MNSNQENREIHPGAGGGFHLARLKTGGANFNIWEADMKGYLQYRGLWDVVGGDGGGQPPDTSNPPVDHQCAQHIIEATLILRGWMDDKLKVNYLETVNPRDVWASLQEQFKVSATAEQERLQLMQDIGNLEMKPDETAEAYLERARALEVKSERLKTGISQKLLYENILSGLTGALQPVGQSLKWNKLTRENIVRAIREADKQKGKSNAPGGAHESTKTDAVARKLEGRNPVQNTDNQRKHGKGP